MQWSSRGPSSACWHQWKPFNGLQQIVDQAGSGPWFVILGIHGSFSSEMAKVCTRHLFTGSGCPSTTLALMRGVCDQSDTTQTFLHLWHLLHCDLVSAHSVWRMPLAVTAGTAELWVSSPALSNPLLQQEFASQSDVDLTVKFTTKKTLKVHFYIRSYLFWSPSREPSLWLRSFVLMWRSLTQKVFAAYDPSVPAPCSPQTFSFILQSLPTTSSRDFCAGYLRIGVLEWNMVMKHLCFDYTLSSAAGFNVLYIPVWLLFLHSLSFIELANANQFWVFINLLLTDKTSVRQEGAWSLVCVL